MSLGKWIAEEILTEESKIKNIVAIYPGRFQPMGKHHAQTYKWLQSKFKDAYVATSGKVDLPKSPFSFGEKKRIINSHGISKVVQVKNPYQSKEILSKYDPKTTAVVFMVGKKDAQRLGGKFFRPWKGTAEVGYEEGAYTIIAPHVSLSVSGYGEMSGTTIRTALGDKSLDKKDKTKLFKGIFGHTKNYDLIVKKLEALNEIVEGFLHTIDIKGILSENSKTATTGGDVDDGPRYFYGSQNSYRKSTEKIAKRLGMEVLNYISGEEEFFNHYTAFPDGPTGSVSYFPTGVPGAISGTNVMKDLIGKPAYKKWMERITSVAQILGYKFLDFLDAEISIPTTKNEPAKEDKPPLDLKESINRSLLVEGGAYGHMAHPFDDRGLTFGDFKQIIELSLQGNLDLEEGATEKTDGQNLFISWTDKLVAARNTGDIKRGGQDSRAIAKKFAGRGNIEKEFNYA